MIQASFEPQLIAKYCRRFPDFQRQGHPLYARGMTVREIQGHLRELYGIEVSPDLISVANDAVLEQVAEWHEVVQMMGAGRVYDVFETSDDSQIFVGVVSD